MIFSRNEVQKFIKKFLKLPHAIGGFILMIFCLRIFSPKKILRNKAVAVVGPADSAFEDSNGEYIDKFDFVIRFNKALVNWDSTKEKYIGRKTDILIHSFLENDFTGGGKLDFDLFKKRGVKYIVNTKHDYIGFRTTFNFYKKYLSRWKVYILSRESFLKCENLFSHKRPTNGFRTLFAVLGAEPKKVFITGFTFFKTPYQKGYRDSLREVHINKVHEERRGIHDSDREFSLFQQILRDCNVEVQLDRKLQGIIGGN